MRRTIGAAVALAMGILAGAAAQNSAAKPTVYKGLEFTATSVERAPTASLKDCPPGANVVNATSKPGEQFAIVTVAFKLQSDYQQTPLKRPTVTDAAGKTYNTAATFVDVGAVPAFSCSFPFRVPEGTKLKSFNVDTASADLTALVDAK